MNPIGIGILAFGAYFGYRGFQRGLVEEVGRLVGLVAAVILGYRLSPFLAQYIGLENELAASAAAFGLI
ncbi:MAG: CvpA family protein, partial [Candidatus Neomarinimicrobiota bacterium]